MREPLKRTPQGKYVSYPDGIEKYSEIVADELCSMFPDVDIIDLDYIFHKQLSFRLMRNLAKESAER